MSKEDSSSFIRAVKDCTAGSVGGIFQVLAGQPFDTVKVRLQTQPIPKAGEAPKFAGPMDCVMKTFKEEGFKGFYKGTATPLVGIGLCVSIQFFALENFKRYFALQNHTSGNTNPNRLNSTQLFIAGAGPVEHIRIRLQAQTSNNAEFKGPIDCIKKIYQNHGISGIYRGQVPTLAREFIGYGAYFATYEYLVQNAMQEQNKRRDELSSLQVCQYGAMAGYSMWILAFPIDVVKSKFQTDGLTKSAMKYQSVVSCCKQILATEGTRGFFKGFVPCILRAAPANAATFLGFEMAMRVLN